MLGVGRAAVARLQTTFRKQQPAGPAPSRNWGGRRQSPLTPEEESAFLKPWVESVNEALRGCTKPRDYNPESYGDFRYSRLLVRRSKQQPAGAAPSRNFAPLIA